MAWDSQPERQIRCTFWMMVTRSKENNLYFMCMAQMCFDSKELEIHKVYLWKLIAIAADWHSYLIYSQSATWVTLLPDQLPHEHEISLNSRQSTEGHILHLGCSAKCAFTAVSSAIETNNGKNFGASCKTTLHLLKSARKMSPTPDVPQFDQPRLVTTEFNYLIPESLPHRHA